MEFTHELIGCIVNNGYAGEVMEAAKKCGAHGGTVVRANGTANGDAEKFFHIPVQPEKELVLILVPAARRDPILHALYQTVGLNTPGQGIAFSLPVDAVVGLTEPAGTQSAAENPSETAEKEESGETV